VVESELEALFLKRLVQEVVHGFRLTNSGRVYDTSSVGLPDDFEHPVVLHGWRRSARHIEAEVGARKARDVDERIAHAKVPGDVISDLGCSRGGYREDGRI